MSLTQICIHSRENAKFEKWFLVHFVIKDTNFSLVHTGWPGRILVLAVQAFNWIFIILLNSKLSWIVTISNPGRFFYNWFTVLPTSYSSIAITRPCRTFNTFNFIDLLFCTSLLAKHTFLIFQMRKKITDVSVLIGPLNHHTWLLRSSKRIKSC